jgi:multiple sugar transport system substrate-binding protein
VVWGFGGTLLRDGLVQVDTPAARTALAWLRRTIVEGLSPPSVTSAAEEESRRLFQSGDAVCMRNWPYSWSEAQRPDSPVRGRVGVASLPTVDGRPGHGALGGWQLALSAHAPPWKRSAATRLIAHLTSTDAAVTMALAYGRNPPRRAVYLDPRLVRGAPFIAGLLPMAEEARPRPVTPYYPMLSDVLQGEFSAAIAGVRSPAQALRQAQALVDRITGVEA